MAYESTLGRFAPEQLGNGDWRRVGLCLAFFLAAGLVASLLPGADASVVAHLPDWHGNAAVSPR